MELLERERFFDELEAILSEVAAGKGRFLLVSGFSVAESIEPDNSPL